MKKLLICLVFMIFFVSSNVNANEICYDILKYEKDNVCPKAKDSGKCLKEAYLEYNKCVENLKNSASPAKIEKEEARREEERKEEEGYALRRRCDDTYRKWGSENCHHNQHGYKGAIRCYKKKIRKLNEISDQCGENFKPSMMLFGTLEDEIEQMELDLDRAIDRERRNN